MSYQQDGRTIAGDLAIENVNKASRVALVSRSNRNYSIGATTGTMAAALGAGGAFFVFRLSPSAGAIQAYIERIRISFVTIIAFTTPITASRRLGIYRGAGAAAASGTSLADFTQKDAGAPASQCAVAQGGDVRIATTAALTVTGIAYETQPVREMPLVHVGAAGAFSEMLTEFATSENSPLILQAGQLLAIRTIPAMDAAGTWQATVNIDWHEALALNSTTVDS